jgi:hypothetical protein
MKKKNLNVLLNKLSKHSKFEKDKLGIISLQDELSESITGGRYATNNGSCQGTNASCGNITCFGSHNGSCTNYTCF